MRSNEYIIRIPVEKLFRRSKVAKDQTYCERSCLCEFMTLSKCIYVYGTSFRFCFLLICPSVYESFCLCLSLDVCQQRFVQVYGEDFLLYNCLEMDISLPCLCGKSCGLSMSMFLNIFAFVSPFISVYIFACMNRVCVCVCICAPVCISVWV